MEPDLLGLPEVQKLPEFLKAARAQHHMLGGLPQHEVLAVRPDHKLQTGMLDASPFHLSSYLLHSLWYDCDQVWFSYFVAEHDIYLFALIIALLLSLPEQRCGSPARPWSERRRTNTA